MKPLREIRDRVGDDIEIMIEGHAFFQLPSALRLARALAEIRPFWLEDVLRVDNVQTLADFRRQIGLPIAATEMLLGRSSYLSLLQAGAADYIMIDPTWGLESVKRDASLTWLRRFNVPATMHDCTGPNDFVFRAPLLRSVSECCPAGNRPGSYSHGLRTPYRQTARDRQRLADSTSGFGFGNSVSTGTVRIQRTRSSSYGKCCTMTESTAEESGQPAAPTKVRYYVMGATTLTAVVLYLDRICIGEIAKLDEFKTGLGLTDTQTGAILSAFFFSYALGQVPAGWLSDRFGARTMLPLYVCVWSLCTILTGMATGFAVLMAARLFFGIAQAGCYPTASSLVKRWVSLPKRGTVSSIVSFGGRFGGAVAPLLTAWLLKDFLGWRAVLTAYGLVGFGVAAYFWRVFRETPQQHPDCNDSEQQLITGGETENEESGPPPFPPLLPLVRSFTMWWMCALQFGINIGWVFLVTWLPTYLKDVREVDPRIGGLMSTIVLFAGIVGMLLGGPLTDYSVRKLGRRWGRSLPLVGCYSLAISAYLSCLYLESAWAFVAAASLVAFATDLSVPGIWAYMQDVGGRNTAAVFGWGNMWGNLGAATTPLLVPIVLDRWDTNGDWHEAFLLFSAGYGLALIAALGINANRKVE